MEQKSLYTLKEIAENLGVHKNTIRKRLKAVDFMLQRNKRKHFYNLQELQLIKSLFNII